MWPFVQVLYCGILPIRIQKIQMKENKSTINFQVELDESKTPEKILWQASDNPDGEEWREVKAMAISLFDKEYKDTYKIDLWTKELQVIEMDRFMFQTLKALADTYYRSTNNAKLASAIQQLAQYFGEEAEIIPRKMANEDKPDATLPDV